MKDITRQLANRIRRLEKRPPAPRASASHFWDYLSGVEPLSDDSAHLDPRDGELLERATAAATEPMVDRCHQRLRVALAEPEADQPYVTGPLTNDAVETVHGLKELSPDADTPQPAYLISAPGSS
jgi:hypothetical protein